jgi:uncharacterized protein (DUF302 family)
MSGEIGFEVGLERPYEEALELTKEALKAEGFGVLTSIDVKETMKEKLDEDFRPYSILGACNPPLAHRALSQDAVAGLLLPCNVTVEANGAAASIIRIANPETVLSVGSLEENPELNAVAHEARIRLERVAEALLAV